MSQSKRSLRICTSNRFNNLRSCFFLLTPHTVHPQRSAPRMVLQSEPNFSVFVLVKLFENVFQFTRHSVRFQLTTYFPVNFKPKGNVFITPRRNHTKCTCSCLLFEFSFFLHGVENFTQKFPLQMSNTINKHERRHNCKYQPREPTQTHGKAQHASSLTNG